MGAADLPVLWPEKMPLPAEHRSVWSQDLQSQQGSLGMKKKRYTNGSRLCFEACAIVI